MKKKKKWREIRSAVTMMCVMIAMLSTATYAWFTMSNNATVTGMQMTAQSGGGLLVSSNAKNWYNAISLETADDSTKAFYPATLLESEKTLTMDITSGGATFKSPKFYSPEYTSDKLAVNGVTILNNTNFDEYVMKKTFYVKDEGAVADTATSIGLKTATTSEVIAALTDIDKFGLNDRHTTDIGGSFVVLHPDSVESNTDDAAADALDAVRIGFLVYNGTYAEDDENVDLDTATTTLVVWEPYSNVTTDISNATYADNKLDATTQKPVEANLKTNADGSINGGNGGNTSGQLFTIPANTEYIRVDVFIWFEGQDRGCVNEIMADTILAQIELVKLNATP